jgi:hypothetical protein
MDFSGVRAAIDAKHGEDAASDQPNESTTEVEQNTQPESELAPQGNQSQQEAKEQAQALFDISKAEKFLLEGKEITREQFLKERMLHSDYTRKTQEFAKERQAWEEARAQEQEQQTMRMDFEADKRIVRDDPTRIGELTQHYPREWVDSFRRELLGQQSQPTREVSAALARDEIESIIESKFKNYDEKVENAKLVGELENIFTDLKSTYPAMKDGRMERFVLTELQAIDERGEKIDRKVIEDTTKSLIDWISQGKISHTRETMKQQSEANKKAKDIGSGGGTPGQAPAKLKLGEVKGALMNHLQTQN